jgi:condensin complex subunit 3
LNQWNVFDYTKEAQQLLKECFQKQKNFDLTFQPEEWANLTPTKALFLKEYSDFCLKNNLEEAYEKVLPELIQHISYLKTITHHMSLLDNEDEKLKLEFILEQLLKIAEQRDFSDEMGRRELQSFTRDFLVHTDVAEELLQTGVAILKKVSSNELDFLRVLAELLYDIEEEEEAENLSEKDKEVAQSVRLLKCLDIVKAAFQHCLIPASENEPLTGLLERFVLPSLTSPRIALRCAGIECLGISCLLDKVGNSLFLKKEKKRFYK